MDNIITIVLSILLATSEILPYIEKIRSNGITEFLVNNLVYIFKRIDQRIHEIEPQTEPLLGNENEHENDTNSSYHSITPNFSSNLNNNTNKLHTMDVCNININSETVLLKLNNSNVKIDLEDDNEI